MAIWNKNNIMLTKNGASVLSKVQSGQGYLTITRAVASSQVVLVDNLSEVEILNPENLELAIIGRRESGDGGSIILLQLSNLHLEQSFQLNEIGIFAKHSEDPDNEFLYIIAQVDTGTGDRVPSYDITPVTATYDFYLYNLKSGDVTFEVSATGLATVAQMNEAVSRLEKKDAELETKIGANTKAIEELDTQGVSSAIDAGSQNSRINHLERLVGNLYQDIQAAGIDPDGYDNALFETFSDGADEIDQTVVKVKSVVSGDDSIDVEDSSNLIIGAHYQLTDGEKTEEVQVKSINVSGSIKRVVLYENVKNQYTEGRTKLYRSSIAIYNGRAYGGGNVRTDELTDCASAFRGSNTKVELTKSIDYSDPSSFTLKGAHLKDGVLVMGGDAYGVAFNAAGSTYGDWKRVNSEGDNLAQDDLSEEG